MDQEGDGLYDGCDGGDRHDLEVLLQGELKELHLSVQRALS